MRLEFGAVGISGPDKNKHTAEDAYFYADGNVQAFGVADGLGGWHSRYGCSPAPFARRLMEICEERVKSGSVFDLPTLLNTAYAKNDREGGASVVLAMFNGHLDVANLGDCRLNVVRDGKIIFGTKDMVSGFNNPYYLGKHNGNHAGYSPLEARLNHVDLKAGDIAIMGVMVYLTMFTETR